MNNSNLTHSQDEHDSYNYFDLIDYYESPNFHTPHYGYFEIRLSIFLIGAVCVGLPCLIWAFYSVHRLRKAKGGISAFIILLLLSDLLQLILYPYIVTKMLTHFFLHEEIVMIVVPGCLKMCSLHLHQLVALETVLTRKYPTISAHLFSSPCYIMISIIILLIPVTCVGLFFCHIHGSSIICLAIGSVLSPVCLLVVTGIITFKAPPTADSTPVNHRPGVKVFIASLVTLLVFFVPFALLCSTQILYFVTYHMLHSCIVMALCLLSLTVIPEPLLCVLVCRENLSAQTQYKQIEHNAEETLV